MVRPSKSGPEKIRNMQEREDGSQLKGRLHEIPISILDLSDVESLEVAIVENIQRDT